MIALLAGPLIELCFKLLDGLTSCFFNLAGKEAESRYPIKATIVARVINPDLSHFLPWRNVRKLPPLTVARKSYRKLHREPMSSEYFEIPIQIFWEVGSSNNFLGFFSQSLLIFALPSCLSNRRITNFLSLCVASIGHCSAPVPEIGFFPISNHFLR